MMGKTHKLIGITTGSLLGVFNFSLEAIAGVFIVWVTSTMPDWDIKLGMKHRRFTHSLLCFGILELLAYLIWEPMMIFVLIGYGGHMLADSFTKSGIALLYPYKKMIGFKLISTESDWDYFILLCCIAYLMHFIA